MATVSDMPIFDEGNNIIASVLSASDYYPFGLTMSGRGFKREGYRFGFNGKEDDNDMFSEGFVQDYGFRIYHRGIARFFSVDPLTSSYPWYTPYQFAGNNPIFAIDLDGLVPKPSTTNLAKTQSVTLTHHGGLLNSLLNSSGSNYSHESFWRLAHLIKTNSFNGALGAVGESQVAFEIDSYLKSNFRAKGKVNTTFNPIPLNSAYNKSGTWDLKSTYTASNFTKFSF